MAYSTLTNAKVDFASLCSSYIFASKRFRWIAATTLLTVSNFFFLFHYQPSVPYFTARESPDDGVEWSRFAYAQYVTNDEYLCNSVMFFEALDRLNSRADRVMMYPSRMLGYDDSSDARLLKKARDSYSVKLVPITVQHKDHADGNNDPLVIRLVPFIPKTGPC